MAKKTFDYRQKLTAPGKKNDWLDASEIALEFGTFTKIKSHRPGNVLSAQYGAADIQITIVQKDASNISMSIECTDPEVMKWFKACVADVICNPKHYSDYYKGEPAGDYKTVQQAQKGQSNIVFKYLSQKWFMILMMIILPPFGLYLNYKYHRTALIKRILITIILVFYTLFVWLGFFGINTGFGLSTITEWFTGVKNQAELKIDKAVQTPTPESSTESQEYVGE